MKHIVTIIFCCFIISAKAQQKTQTVFVYESVKGLANYSPTGESKDISQPRTIIMDLSRNRLLISPEAAYGGITLVELTDATTPSPTPYKMFNFKGIGKDIAVITGSLLWIENDENSVLKINVSNTNFYYFIKKEIK